MAYDNYGGGGGYMTNSSPGMGSQSSPGGTKKTASHSLTPVTIKQTRDATQAHEDSELCINGVECGQITVVAQLISITPQTTNNVYWLDDGTGHIEARVWMDTSSSDESSDRPEGIVEGCYVRVTGTLKQFNKKRYINATHVRASSDPHELYFHFMEAMYVTLVHLRGPPGQAGQVAEEKVSPYTSGTSSTAVDQYAHLPPLQRRIMDYIISQPFSEEGVHVALIARSVKSDANSISEALDKLMDDGVVFSTKDESHFNAAT